MTAPVVLAAAAEADLVAAADWYDTHAPGLGKLFLGAVDAVLDRLPDYPEMHPRAFAQVRRATLPRFRYAVVYRVQSASIEVLGVLPCRADPQWLVRRSGGA